MTRRWLPLLLCLVVCLCALQRSTARDRLRVNETATTIQLDNRQATVSLALENPSGGHTPARIRLELLDPDNRVCAIAERDETLREGSSHATVALPFAVPEMSERSQLPWLRLRYHVAPTGDAAAAAEGILSLSEITPDLFNLYISGAGYAFEGMRYRARVHTAHPVSMRPSKGVAVEATIEFGGDDNLKPLHATATTDAEGSAALDFDLPRETTADEMRITVTGQRGQIVQTATDEVRVDHLAEILINTDKPIYQPGQMLHARMLLIDYFANRAVAGADAEIEIEDPDDSTVFRASVKTSRFGIASIDWPIPDNTRLGEYDIRVSIEGGEYDDAQTMQRIKISRYELPNFSVNVKPDHTYYLPGQHAEVEVRADYLFGQPVKRGHVRVVRESERDWNYEEQKWEAKEEETYEGEADETGRFVARIDLSKAHQQLAAQDDSDERPFRDYSYAAYFTDPTTNRTEQRRFDLRATKEAIHVYVIGDEENPARNLPVRFYLSTFYADGTPAPSTVEIRQQPASPAYASINASTARVAVVAPRTLRTVKTNRFGLAEVSDVRPVFNADDDEDENVSLVITARDRQGRTGHRTKEFKMDADRAMVRVEPLKTLHRAGEPLRAEITASVAAQTAFVEVVRESKVVHAETVRLEGGKASVKIPYKPEFKDALALVAMLHPVAGNDNSPPAGSHTVLYPRERNLQLDVRMNQETYKPGEDALADFRVLTPDGRAVESALGVTVFDRAIEERARTDREFGGNQHDYNWTYLHRRGASENLGGVTRSQLERLDLAHRRPPEGLDLVADIMLNRTGSAVAISSFNETFARNPATVFRSIFARQFAPVSQALSAHYGEHDEYPKTDADLRRLLRARNIDLDALHDPWGMPYSARFSVEREADVLRIVSVGADKEPGTEDDCYAFHMQWPYFLSYGTKINQALEQHHQRTGEFIRHAATLKSELALLGIDFDALRDPWGNVYKAVFGMHRTNLTITIQSGGANGRFESERTYGSDDFDIWTASIDYFTPTRARIDTALDEYVAAGNLFPRTDAEFRAALQRARVDGNALLDVWGRPFATEFSIRDWNGAQASIITYVRGQERPREKVEIKSVLKTVNQITLTSAGADGKHGNDDDFQAANFSRLFDSKKPVTNGTVNNTATRVAASLSTTIPALKGALSGVVLDPNGAVIPGVSVTATHRATRQVHTTQTGEEGDFIFHALPDGLYDVEMASSGFANFLISEVKITSAMMTEIKATLQVSGTSEEVIVSAGGTELSWMTSTSMTTRFDGAIRHDMSALKVAERKQDASARAQEAAISTPRLREYFPETLLWQPALETDASGHAQLRFKLADNITTWKMSIVASTADGEIGLVEKEFRAFQPFFVEHDPPRVLTEGDEIQLPVVVRNYLERPQTVDVDIKPENWFTLSGSPRQRQEVAAGEAARATFDMRVVASVRDGKQRVTAIASDDSDAIEKPVTVHPDGQEIVETSARIFTGAGTLEANIPDAAIRSTPRAELKLYADLMAHVVEGVEGIMQRPYGCGEQTVSSTYPSLLVLRHYRQDGGNNETPPPVAAKAQHYVEEGYKRLLGYRHASGGFAYWHQADPDPALTAYALQFLADAASVIPVDRDAMRDARLWLVRQQTKEGGWKPRNAYGDARARTLILTAYVARVLARVRPTLASLATNSVAADADSDKAAAASLKNALDFLAPHIAASREPQLAASYALAALAAGDPANARRALELLRAQAHAADGAAHWRLSSETPFHGWGLTGQIEATALVVQALTRHAAANRAAVLDGEDGALVNRALLYLFRNKDRYGVWHSTQATVNVLDAFTALSSNDAPSVANAGGDANVSTMQFEILVNGTRAINVALPRSSRPTNASTVDLSPYLDTTGNNRIEIRNASPANARTSSQTVAQLVTTYYVPWSAPASVRPADASPGAGAPTATADALRLSVNFDKTEAAINQEINCRVEAGRTAFNGYGMLLGEIGLPPGAEVDRASLELAVNTSGGRLDHYDVLPDRLVVYLWPSPSKGVGFTFKFRTRFGLVAKTAPSRLYDYYNPQAHTVVPPTKFVIR